MGSSLGSPARLGSSLRPRARMSRASAKHSSLGYAAAALVRYPPWASFPRKIRWAPMPCWHLANRLEKSTRK
eukprot:1594095-Alexandrium_andersonii.AAC.1